MRELEQYVLDNLAADLAEVRKYFGSDYPISDFERTIIYKYTEDGYVDLNAAIRKKPDEGLSEFGKHLRKALENLPSFNGLVYRGVSLTPGQFRLYQKHLSSKEPLVEHAFLSTSYRRTLAMKFGTPYLFVIHCKNGKSVEEYARFGTGSVQNESEVILLNNSTFTVADILEEMIE